MSGTPDTGRYRLLHTIGGRPAQHGRWGNEKVAREKLSECVDLHRATGARITLTDEETGTVLTAWPDEQ